MRDKPTPNYKAERDGKPVPTRRFSRMVGLSGVAAGIAGRVALGGAKQVARGNRPNLGDLLLTPANAVKLTRQLSNMRGAAMKMGQIISMENDFLPKEFSDILARLRADAQHMPQAQLEAVLADEWGEDWEAKFETFYPQPIAAASIGQVQRADLPSGDSLAIKVQYPGVRDSIDSDINNVAGLLKISGLIPAHMDVKPIIEEGRKQLHEEADYKREADFMARFGKLLAGDKDFDVPDYYPEFSTDKILAMSYIESDPIETLMEAPQELRDHIAERLFDLTLRELFSFKLMQTDPNFANYRYNQETGAIVLLDFGASREIEPHISGNYRDILSAILNGNHHDVFRQLSAKGFIPSEMEPRYRSKFLDMIELILVPLKADVPFDFGENNLAISLQEDAMDIAANRKLWHVPPAEIIFIQRKLGGLYMLASRLRARINLYRLMQSYL